jgi:hypothetical protein
MVSLVDRKPTFLAETEWKTIPFSGDGPPKTMLDLLIDILVEFPGVLAAIDSLRQDGLGRYALIRQAVELATWVRRLKEDHLWMYLINSTAPASPLKSYNVLALCELCTGLDPYNPLLGEALLCYCAAHLILTRISTGMTQKMLLLTIALRPPYSLLELVQAIVLVSERQMSANVTDMISLIVTTFALTSAATTTELDEKAPIQEARDLLDDVNASFSRKFNIRYSGIKSPK